MILLDGVDGLLQEEAASQIWGDREEIQGWSMAEAAQQLWGWLPRRLPVGVHVVLSLTEATSPWPIPPPKAGLDVVSDPEPPTPEPSRIPDSVLFGSLREAFPVAAGMSAIRTQLLNPNDVTGALAACLGLPNGGAGLLHGAVLRGGTLLSTEATKRLSSCLYLRMVAQRVQMTCPHKARLGLGSG